MTQHGGETSGAARRGEAWVAPDAHCSATRHGTRAAYVAGCRCPEARKANRNYAKYRDRRTAHATFGAAAPFSVPASDVVTVLDQLRATGWTLRRVEATTGIGRDHIARIYGKTGRPLRRVRWATYQRLRGLLDQETAIAGGALVDAAPTWQRIRGLIALGYPKTWIAQQLDLGRALQLDERRVMQRNAVKVLRLVDTYGGTPGPSPRARAYAAARGWTSDLLWQADDEPSPTTSCPTHTHDVDEVAVERAVAGEYVPLTRAERREVYKVLRDKGYNPSAAGQRLRLSGATTQRYEAALCTQRVPSASTAAHDSVAESRHREGMTELRGIV